MPFVTTAALVGVALFGRGSVSVSERMLAPVAYLQVIPGLIWGAYIAFLLRRSWNWPQASTWWSPVNGALGMIMVSSVAIGIVLGHARQIPDFVAYACDWDARHLQLIQLRDSGLREVEVNALDFDLSQYLVGFDMSTLLEKDCAERYYNMETISVVQS